MVAQKREKNGMPKKHDPKKERDRKKGVTMSQKKRDRDDLREKSHYLKE